MSTLPIKESKPTESNNLSKSQAFWKSVHISPNTWEAETRRSGVQPGLCELSCLSKPNDLSSIPGVHVVAGENQLGQVILCSPCAHPGVYTHAQIRKRKEGGGTQPRVGLGASSRRYGKKTDLGDLLSWSKREGAYFPFCALLCSHTPPRSFSDPPEPLGQNLSLLRSLRGLCDLPAPPVWLCLLSPSLWVYYMVVSLEGESFTAKIRSHSPSASMGALSASMFGPYIASSCSHIALQLPCILSVVRNAYRAHITVCWSCHSPTIHQRVLTEPWRCLGSFPVAICVLFWGLLGKQDHVALTSWVSPS